MVDSPVAELQDLLAKKINVARLVEVLVKARILTDETFEFYSRVLNTTVYPLGLVQNFRLRVFF